MKRKNTSVLLSSLGCGAGGQKTSGSTVSTRSIGSLKISVAWPTVVPTRVVPDSARSIRVDVGPDDGSSVLFSRVLVRRPGQTSDEITFPSLPVGNIRIRATALPSTDGSSTGGVPLAVGDTFETIRVGETVTAPTLTMFSTIKTIKVTGDIATPLKVGEQRTYVATGYDANGRLVLTSPAGWQWIGSGLGAADYQFDKDLAQVTAFRSGSFTLALHYLEGDSDKGGTSVYNDPVTITVVAGAPKTPVRIIDLGSLSVSSDTSYARGITEGIDANSVAVCGSSQAPDGTTHGFLWQSGKIIDIGVLDKKAVGSDAFGVAIVPDISGHTIATLAGVAYVVSGGNPSIPEAITFGDTNGNGQADPFELADRGIKGSLNAINTDGAAVGKKGGSPFNAIYISPLHGNGDLPGFADSGLAQASAYDLNAAHGSAEEIVGSSFGHGSSEHPCSWNWNPTNNRYDPPIDLGLASGTTSGVATSLSYTGAVAGYCQGGRSYAFIWTSASGIANLPGVGADDRTSRAAGINHFYDPNTKHLFDGSVEIAGHAVLGTGNIVAVLWTAATPAGPFTAHDLNKVLPLTSGWTLNEAQAVNGNGLIVGYGTNPQGKTHAFLLVP